MVEVEKDIGLSRKGKKDQIGHLEQFSNNSCDSVSTQFKMKNLVF